MQIELTCQNCGKSFTAKRSDARYCSNSCRQLRYFNRINEEQERVKQLESDKKEALHLLMEYTGKLQEITGGSTLSKNRIEILLVKISDSEDLFSNLPEHKTILEAGIKGSCNSLLIRLRNENASELQLDHNLKVKVREVLQSILNAIRELIRTSE